MSPAVKKSESLHLNADHFTHAPIRELLPSGTAGPCETFTATNEAAKYPTLSAIEVEMRR